MVKIGQLTPCGGWWLKKHNFLFNPFLNGEDLGLKKPADPISNISTAKLKLPPTACLSKPLQQRQPSNRVAVLASLRTPGSSRETEITKMTIDLAAHRSRVIGMGNGWVGPYNPVYVQPSGGRER